MHTLELLLVHLLNLFLDVLHDLLDLGGKLRYFLFDSAHLFDFLKLLILHQVIRIVIQKMHLRRLFLSFLFLKLLFCGFLHLQIDQIFRLVLRFELVIFLDGATPLIVNEHVIEVAQVG